MDTLTLFPPLGCQIMVCDYKEFLSAIPNNSVDLILTDPPYSISRKSGFKALGPNSVKRFAVDMDFGDWDHTEINLNELASLSYETIRPGGTAIIWYDLWKSSYLATAMIDCGFKQLRWIEWQKTNPVPLNSKVNYLTNSREIAIAGVKIGKPTFNSEYDSGTYQYAIPNNGQRFHPTQKPIGLFSELIIKHSNEEDLVVDPFLGSGTTALASLKNNRQFHGCDISDEYIEIARKRMHWLLLA